jgi:hypothetical protein
MRCMECQRADMVTVVEPVCMEMPFVGVITTSRTEHERCPVCGETMLPPVAAQAVDDAYYAKQERLLGRFPIDDYVTADVAREILGKSRQAVAKDGRIRRGFVYRIRKGRAWLYLRKSVEQYRDTEDGRFPLSVSPPFRLVRRRLEDLGGSAAPGILDWQPVDQRVYEGGSLA